MQGNVQTSKSNVDKTNVTPCKALVCFTEVLIVFIF